jgi:serine/threonine protein kinase
MSLGGGAELDDAALVAAVRRRGPCGSREVAEELAMSHSLCRVQARLSALSARPRDGSRRPRGDKPLVRLPGGGGKGAAAVLYAAASGSRSSGGHSNVMSPAALRICLTCGANIAVYQVVGGDYTASARVAAMRAALPLCICELCFRQHWRGEEGAVEVGVAALPADMVADGFTEVRSRLSSDPRLSSASRGSIGSRGSRAASVTSASAVAPQPLPVAVATAALSSGDASGAGAGVINQQKKNLNPFGQSMYSDNVILSVHQGKRWDGLELSPAAAAAAAKAHEAWLLGTGPAPSSFAGNVLDEVSSVSLVASQVSSGPGLLSHNHLRQRVLEESVSAVRELGIRGGLLREVVERVAAVLGPLPPSDLGALVQTALHEVSSKTLKGAKPLLRRAMVGVDGQLQVLFVAKELVDPLVRPLRSSLGTGASDVEAGAAEQPDGIRLEVVEGSGGSLFFGLRGFTTFRISVDGRERGSGGVELLRRYSDFEWLRAQLIEWHGHEAMVPPLPPKRFVGRFNASFLEARMHALEHFLSMVATHPALDGCDALQVFFRPAPLDSLKAEYDKRGPRRAEEKRRRRGRPGGRGLLLDSPGTFTGTHCLGSGGGSSRSNNNNPFLLQDAAMARRVALLVSPDFQRALRKAYKRMERVADLHLAQAQLLESRSAAFRLLAAAELPDASEPEHAKGRPEVELLSEVPLSERSEPLAALAGAAVELLGGLSRADLLAGTAERAACIRTTAVKMQLKEWQRSLGEFAPWLENRAATVRMLERELSQQQREEGSKHASGTLVDDVDAETRRAAALAERAREDAEVESRWLVDRNSQELVEVMTSFAQLQMEHARQMSRMWQDFLPQLFTTLDANSGHGNSGRGSNESSLLPTARVAAAQHAQLPVARALAAATDAPRNLAEEESYATCADPGARKHADAWEIDPRDIAFGECIGRGSFGEVHAAVWHGRRVAVKSFLPRGAAVSERARLDFRREAAVMRGLPPHPNLVTFFGMSSKPGGVCLIMELVESGSLLDLLLYSDKGRARRLIEQQRQLLLQQKLKQQKKQQQDQIIVRHGVKQHAAHKHGAAHKSHDDPSRSGSNSSSSNNAVLSDDELSALDPGWRLKLALGAARGFLALHSLRPQVLHRDVKTSNLLVQIPSLNVKVCDFGLARFKLDHQSVKSFVGTASWVAPEVIMSREGYSAKADVYSFAVVLWQIFARAQPYPALHATQVMFQVAREGLRPVMPQLVPPLVRQLIVRCWDHDPERRPDFEHIVKELESLTR